MSFCAFSGRFLPFLFADIWRFSDGRKDKRPRCSRGH
jgi:hypothetical protein